MAELSAWFAKGSLALSHATPVHHGQDRPLWSIRSKLSKGFASVSDLLCMLIFFLHQFIELGLWQLFYPRRLPDEPILTVDQPIPRQQ